LQRSLVSGTLGAIEGCVAWSDWANHCKRAFYSTDYNMMWSLHNTP
jgi:hypothetical protein